jgi:hypothetical protein
MIVSPGLARAAKEEWRYDVVVGSHDDKPTMLIRHLFHWRGWRIDLHRMVDVDAAACFHTHPAWAVRIVLRGGYVEEMADGKRRTWRPGMIGVVRPSLAHRVDKLRNGIESWSLWLRAPKRHRIVLIGNGWAERARCDQ